MPTGALFKVIRGELLRPNNVADAGGVVKPEEVSRVSHAFTKLRLAAHGVSLVRPVGSNVLIEPMASLKNRSRRHGLLRELRQGIGAISTTA